MSLTISTQRHVSMTMRGEVNNPIATFNEYAGMSGTTISSNVGVATDGALANAANGGTYDFWTPTQGATSEISYRITRASAFTINFVGIAAHNIGTIGGLTISLEYSNNGTSWTDLLFNVAPTDDKNIGLYFQDVSATNFRLLIGGLSQSDVLYVGAIHFAEALTMPTRIYQGYTPPLQATSVALQSNVTEGNNYIGSSVVRAGIGASASINLLPDTFVRGDDFQAFQSRFNNAKPFFWAWRPVKYQDLLYAWRSGGPIVPTNSGPKAYMSFEMQMRAYDDQS